MKRTLNYATPVKEPAANGCLSMLLSLLWVALVLFGIPPLLLAVFCLAAAGAIPQARVASLAATGALAALGGVALGLAWLIGQHPSQRPAPPEVASLAGLLLARPDEESGAPDVSRPTRW